MTVVLILVILGFCALAIDLSRMYNRKVELQTAADTIALTAARELDGTVAGVSRARSAAMRAAMNIFYDYNNANVEWTEDAMSFGAKPDGDIWFDAASAAQPSRAASLFHARVDTKALTARHGDVLMLLMHLFPNIGSGSTIGSIATAGRVSIDVMPLAVCAMSDFAGEARGTELVEYGFRRGVSYNLMKLNPGDTSKGANFLVNPLALAGTTGASVRSRMDVMRPFACTGTLAIPSLAGGNITV
ncbi:MAG: pilus assembly protein TadG-related protein, partial [Telluria sp.]